MISLEAFFSCYLLPLKEELQDIVRRLEPLPVDFIGILRHYLDEKRPTSTPHQIWNSRYVQPMLCLLACEACNGDWQQALPAAAVIELIQTFFLAHDEARAKDDPQRKSFAGKSQKASNRFAVGNRLRWVMRNMGQSPTLPGAAGPCVSTASARANLAQASSPRQVTARKPWRKAPGSFTQAPWGYAQEINAGDALFALANLALGRLCERGVPATIIVDAAYLLNRASLTLATGQYLHFDWEKRGNITIADYLVMAEGKTALAVCACEVGALIASATDVQRESLRSFGRHLGLAHYIHSSVRRGWDEGRCTDAAGEISLRPDKRDFIEQLAQEQRKRAIAALEKGDLKGAAVQALRELAQMPFSSESLFRLAYDVETVSCL